MWDVLVRAPLGSNTQRKFVTFIASFLVACFGYAIMASTPVYAASDATWSSDDTLSHDGRDYKGPVTATQNDKTTLPVGTLYFTSFDDANARTGTPAVGYVIFFPPSTNLSKATSATYRQGDYDVTTGKFSNLTTPEDVGVDAKSWGTGTTLQPSSCDVEGIGWLICPVSGYIASGMDYLYSLLSYFLEVAPITGSDNSIYQMWNIVKGIANICFIIAFLIIIYAQISGAFVSNYTIKKMLPRLVIAALLVNTSYWICSIAVDLSNILGASVQDVFQNMQQQIGAANSEASELSWETATAYALGGGAGVIGLSALAGATYFGGGAFAFLIIGALIPALFAVFVAVAVLAARQALITVLIVLSPLAFVAYLLPNTEDMFNRWRKLFMNLLIIFPAFSVIFGASQLTGVLIIQNATIFPVVILGLLVQVAPLFITPFLIKLSSGLFSTIAGMTNDRSKGVFDRAKNWAGENQEMYKNKALARGLNPENSLRRKRLTGVGAKLGNGKMHRDRMTAGYKAEADGYYSGSKKGQKAFMQDKVGKTVQGLSDADNERTWQKRLVNEDPIAASRLKPAKVLEWQNERKNEKYGAYKHMLHDTHEAQGDAKIIEDSIHDDGERHFRDSIENASAGSYKARLRGMQSQSVVDKGLAERSKKVVEAQGERALKQTIEEGASGAFKTRENKIKSLEKQAEAYDSATQKDAEAAYDTFAQTDQATRTLRLKETRSSTRADQAKEEWDNIIRNISSTDRGVQVDGISVADIAVADQIREASRNVEIQGQIKTSGEIKKQSNFVNALKQDTAEAQQLREKAAGVDDVYGAKRVLATMKAADTKEMMTNIENFRSTMAYDKASDSNYLKREFEALEDTEENLVERISYAQLMNKNGSHGIATLRDTLRDFTAGKQPDDPTMLALKEIMGSDDTFKKNGRDFEVWSNNERDAEGNLFADFDAVVNSSKTWGDVKATRFAAMAKPNQMEGMRKLQQIDPTKLQDLAQRVIADPVSMGNLKGVPQQMIKLLANDPHADLSGFMGDIDSDDE